MCRYTEPQTKHLHNLLCVSINIYFDTKPKINGMSARSKESKTASSAISTL